MTPTKSKFTAALNTLDENGGYDIKYMFYSYSGKKIKSHFRKYLIFCIKADTRCSGKIAGQIANEIIYNNYYGALPKSW